MIEKEENKFDKFTNIILILLVIVFSAFYGFIYETIFYKIDLGYFVKRGTTYGPWIPIYGFGALFITLVTYKINKKPLVVFLLSCIVCGLLEFLTGYLLYNIGGIRLWDYNTEIWNFGNIGGYICLRSVLFFGISGVVLKSVIIPTFKNIIIKSSKKVISIISLTLGTLFFVDTIASSLIRFVIPWIFKII